MSVWNGIRGYVATDDPLVSAGNQIAVVVAWNQPFYPLYIYWLVGGDIGVPFLILLSTPLYLAVPLVARLDPLAGRALLPLAGIINTILGAKLFGEASGVELFLVPCTMAAAMLFRRSDRLVMLPLVGLTLVVYLGLHGHYGSPVHLYTPAEYDRFLALNAVSVGTLTAFIGIVFANALAAIEDRR